MAVFWESEGRSARRSREAERTQSVRWNLRPRGLLDQSCLSVYNFVHVNSSSRSVRNAL
ncbi:hypothetical protein FTUN_8590 [Frigoriglobus tundricola]|uniref:Uncharacterized protein n=1 Tax=Frigoriglobus tundricola TaxID=2774151 RepID=A0A6M5Z5V0_9BACT|nr:hypothetical protein FTUN_8590 [Frigoriglobus tundricola]